MLTTTPRGVMTNVEAHTVIRCFYAGSALTQRHPGGARPERPYPHDYLSAWRRPPAEGPAKHGRRAAPGTDRPQRQARLFCGKRGWNGLLPAWATRSAVSDTTTRQRGPTNRLALTRMLGRTQIIRSLLAAGECHDMNGEAPIGCQRLPDGHRCRTEHLAAPIRQKASAQSYGARESLAGILKMEPPLPCRRIFYSIVFCRRTDNGHFCQRCGTELPVSARFCSNCGAVVPAATYTPGRPLVRRLWPSDCRVCIGLAQAYGWI